MLTVAYEFIAKQLQRNLDEQDFYKNICTEIKIKEYVIQLLHPCYIKDKLTGTDVFPEKAQNDIDKEFAPSIALYVLFSMKKHKQELERFCALENFTAFKEIKDYGQRIYVMDFGIDVKKATEICISIIKNVFQAETAKSLTVITVDTENGEQICKRMIRAPKKEPEPIKVDGVATRVVMEENLIPKKSETVEPAKDILISEISNKTYKQTLWTLCFIAVLIITGLIVFVVNNNIEKKGRAAYEKDLKSLSEDSSDSIRAENIVNTETPEIKTEMNIIGTWRETDNGASSSYNDNNRWQLVQYVSDGQYKLMQINSGKVFRELKCVLKKIRKSNEYTFHDVRNEQTFTLKNGTEIYFIPNIDDGANAIIFIDGTLAYMYINDMNPKVYDYYATLCP